MPRSILKVPIRVAINGRVCEWKAWGEGGVSPELSHPPSLKDTGHPYRAHRDLQQQVLEAKPCVMKFEQEVLI